MGLDNLSQLHLFGGYHTFDIPPQVHAPPPPFCLPKKEFCLGTGYLFFSLTASPQEQEGPNLLQVSVFGRQLSKLTME